MPERRRTIRTVETLLKRSFIAPDQAADIREVAKRYAVSITPAMQDQILSHDPDDPVAKQFVPSAAELHDLPGEMADPIGDDPFTKVKGITHRYPDRLLLKPLHLCPVYCRFCFRREVVGPSGGMLSREELDRAFDYIRSHPEVWEVIFTGGDPLILAPSRLGPMITALDEIDHVKVIRIHTRVPVVDPDRITDELLAALTVTTPVWIVIHCNHRQELGAGARESLRRLSASGFPLLNQSVLLKGVNDTPQALEDLFRALVENRVKPYYLHQGDLAPGTSHFRTTIDAGQELMRALRGTVSGVCQPTYILDIPGGYGKVPIGPGYLSRDQGGYLVTDPWGAVHSYPPAI